MSHSDQDSTSAAGLFDLLGVPRRCAGNRRHGHPDTSRHQAEVGGHRVEEARDGLEGVDLALAITPEVAFIDIDLPGIDGYEVGRRIRSALGSRVLLVALAAYGQERRSSEAGFDAHLVKPVSHEDLTRVFGRAAGRDG